MSTFSIIEAPKERGFIPPANLEHLARAVEIGIWGLDLGVQQYPKNRWLKEQFEYTKWIIDSLVGQTGESIRSRILRAGDHPMATPTVFVLVPKTIIDGEGRKQNRLVVHDIGIPTEPLVLYFERVDQPLQAELLLSYSIPPILNRRDPNYRSTVEVVTKKMGRGLSALVVDRLMQSPVLSFPGTPFR